jgi:hypothetical protein
MFFAHPCLQLIMINQIKVLLIFSFFFGVVPAYAAFSPISLSIAPPVQFPPEDFNITGLRLSLLYGRQRDIYGLDLAAGGNITDGNFAGLAVSGIFNKTNGTTTILGLQAAGGFNINSNKATIIGLQVALGMNHNSAESSLWGVQLAAVNLSEHTKVHGAQIGLYNLAEEVYGFQIGVINHCKDLHGLQIGFLNWHDDGLFKVSPILNFGF